jgi:hypothetical protein
MLRWKRKARVRVSQQTNELVFGAGFLGEENGLGTALCDHACCFNRKVYCTSIVIPFGSKQGAV